MGNFPAVKTAWCYLSINSPAKQVNKSDHHTNALELSLYSWSMQWQHILHDCWVFIKLHNEERILSKIRLNLSVDLKGFYIKLKNWVRYGTKHPKTSTREAKAVRALWHQPSLHMSSMTDRATERPCLKTKKQSKTKVKGFMDIKDRKMNIKLVHLFSSQQQPCIQVIIEYVMYLSPEPFLINSTENKTKRGNEINYATSRLFKAKPNDIVNNIFSSVILK